MNYCPKCAAGPSYIYIFGNAVGCSYCGYIELMKSEKPSGLAAWLPENEKPKECVCGQEKTSRLQPYQVGHSPWCDVHESKR